MNEKVEVHQNGSGAVERHGESLSHSATPLVDIYETRDAFVLALDLPGARRDAISLSVHKGVLSVKADVHIHQIAQDAGGLRELRTPGYYRSFRIGEGIDVTTIDAQYDLGVLTVKLLKSPELKPREIPIH